MSDLEENVEEMNLRHEEIEDSLAEFNLPPEHHEAVTLSQRLAAELAAQGELEAGNGMLKATLEFIKSAGSGALNVSTMVLPGVSDVRDVYELFVGKDLITGAELTTPERALAGLGILIGSGVAFRKGLASFKRTSDLNDIYNTTDVYKSAELFLEGATNLEKYGPLREGQLHRIKIDDKLVADTFTGGDYLKYETTKKKFLWRVQDTATSEQEYLGRFWTDIEPQGPYQATVDLALNPSWGNQASRWVKIEVPIGTTEYFGRARAQGIKKGNGNQIFIEKPNKEWVVDEGEF